MSYSDILSLQDYYYPVFNLQDETIDYWKQFIPTTQFNDLLKTTLDSISTNTPSNRKSIWMQGTFGTGKSHASSVIKHLLYDDINEIEDYIEKIEDSNLKHRLISFRKNNKYFPVILKDIEGVNDPRTFCLTIERKIKQALKEKDINIIVESDFENAINYIENTPLDIDSIINSEPQLRIYCKTKEDIIKKLKAFDNDIFVILESVLSKPKYSVYISKYDITQWLKEVEEELKKKDIAQGLIIFWDEFTSLAQRIDILQMSQKIAELSEKNNIYLFLINHKNISDNNELKKTKDRFHYVDYKMETITTYHIMAASIKLKNKESYLSTRTLRMEKMDNYDELIEYLTADRSTESYRNILNLFPLHPYSAYLCTSIADHFGSTNRSVMQFMYDEEKGFMNFINNTDNWENLNLLTPDILWDYFQNEFNNDFAKYGAIINNYTLNKSKIAEKGDEYLKVFKGTLLLNVLKNTYEAKQIIPSKDNIQKLFEGYEFDTQINDILDYFNVNEIITKDPSNNYLITNSTLPNEEINNQISKYEFEYTDALKILEYTDDGKKDILKIFNDYLIRLPEVLFLSCKEDESRIISKINHTFKDEYKLPIVIFIGLNNNEIKSTKSIVGKLAKDGFKDKVFIFFDEIFDFDGLQQIQFIKYISHRIVANKHNLNDVESLNYNYAKKIIENWVNRIKKGNYSLFYNEDIINGNITKLADYLNNNICQRIFIYGYENIEGLNKPISFFKPTMSKTICDTMLSSLTRSDVEKKLVAQHAPAKLLLQYNGDYIIDENLKIKEDAPNNHPLVTTQKKIDSIFDKIKKDNIGIFNLGERLKEVTKPPYGLYGNIPNMVLLSFTLRKYVNEFFDTEIGKPINESQMRDKVIAIFTSWEKGVSDNKLRVRFGSKEEKELKDYLIKIFDLNEKINNENDDQLSSIKNVRWAIVKHYINDYIKLPLWILKYNDKIPTDINKVIIDINFLIQNSSDNIKIDDIKSLLNSIKNYDFELFKVINEKSNFVNALNVFIVKNDNTFNFDWYDDFIEYLKQNLQPEIAFWTEYELENALLRFTRSKLIPNVDEPVYKPQIDNIKAPVKATLSDETKKVKLFNKISNSNYDSNTWKFVIKEIVNNFPETIDFIEVKIND